MIAKDIVEIPGPGAVWCYSAGVALRRQRHVPAQAPHFVDAVAETYRT